MKATWIPSILSTRVDLLADLPPEVHQDQPPMTSIRLPSPRQLSRPKHHGICPRISISLLHPQASSIMVVEPVVVRTMVVTRGSPPQCPISPSRIQNNILERPLMTKTLVQIVFPRSVVWVCNI